MSKEPRTQKAKGIVALFDKRYNLEHYGIHLPGPTAIISNDTMRSGEYQGLGRFEDWLGEVKVFARPCPIRPRHGFVESRPLRGTKAEVEVKLKELFTEVLEADPEAEMILMPPIEAEFSGIITPSVMVVGPGHDGATAGRGAITIPVASNPEFFFSKSELEAAGVVGTPYFEFVYGKPSTGHTALYLTQLRDGPAVGAQDDYIPPGRTIVKRVIRITGNEDLLEFERLVKRLTPGDVIYHPGGSVASHYGVHCVVNQVPYITSYEPKPGETLKAAKVRHDLKLLARYIAKFGRSKPELPRLEVMGKRLLAAFGVVHGAGAMLAAGIDERTAPLIAWALVEIVRAATAASMGELRYMRNVDGVWTLDGFDRLVKMRERDSIYRRAYRYKLEQMIRALRIAVAAFWIPPWPDNYGGPKWAKSSAMALAVAVPLARFTSTLSERDLKVALEAANRLVNAVHNGGWYLNKILDPGKLDLAANAPAFAIAQAPDLLDILKTKPPKRLVPIRIPKWDKNDFKYTLPGLEDLYERFERLGVGDARPPADAIPAEVQVVKKGKHLHAQVKMHVQKNRSYGGAFDAPISKAEFSAIVLAGVLKYGKPGRASFHPHDEPNPIYTRAEGAAYERRDNTLWIKINGKWYTIFPDWEE